MKTDIKEGNTEYKLWVKRNRAAKRFDLAVIILCLLLVIVSSLVPCLKINLGDFFYKSWEKVHTAVDKGKYETKYQNSLSGDNDIKVTDEIVFIACQAYGIDYYEYTYNYSLTAILIDITVSEKELKASDILNSEADEIYKALTIYSLILIAAEIKENGNSEYYYYFDETEINEIREYYSEYSCSYTLVSFVRMWGKHLKHKYGLDGFWLWAVFVPYFLIYVVFALWCAIQCLIVLLKLIFIDSSTKRLYKKIVIKKKTSERVTYSVHIIFISFIMLLILKLIAFFSYFTSVAMFCMAFKFSIVFWVLLGIDIVIFIIGRVAKSKEENLNGALMRL